MDEIERLRKAAHDAPLARLGMRHTGERFIEIHTDAWARASREWMKAAASARKAETPKGENDDN